MILSTNQELGEYERVATPVHVAKVWSAIERHLPDYWEKFVSQHRTADGLALLAAKFGGPQPRNRGEAQAIAAALEPYVDAYDKNAAKYRTFLDPESMEEFQDDPGAFKSSLARDLPVVARTLQQQRPELREWQQAFRACRARDLVTVFTNVLDFAEDWQASHPPALFAATDEPAAFGLGPLDDEAMTIPKVIGMGIKSITLFYLDPERFAPRGRNGLYGLYFLSGMDDFGLPSRSSEFLMINDRAPASDGSIIMDQNYWYPYNVFTLYSLRVFRWIAATAGAAGYTVDPTLRFVFTDAFFESVCDAHKEHLKTMRAHERFG